MNNIKETNVFLEDTNYIMELPMKMREELTEKGVIPKEVAPDDTELVVNGAGGWCVVWYEGDEKKSYMPWTSVVKTTSTVAKIASI